MSASFSLPTLQPPPPPPPPIQLPGDQEELAIREAIREQGRQAGFEAGRQEAIAELSGVIAALRAAADDMTQQRDALAETVEPAALSLALAGAEQIVGAALSLDPDLVAHAVEGALRRIVDRERVTILVNPDDLDRMRAHAEHLAEELGGIGGLEVQVERRIATGGVIVQTPEGDIDARLDTRVARLADTIREALAPSAHPHD